MTLMTTGLDETLLIQARDLLEQCSEQLQRPGGPEQIRAKAVECHGQMLALGELQRSEAIEYALAGAQLLAALHGHPCSDPDWVAIHEEQCCRYGALWVQAAFKEKETAQTIAWGHQALVLVDRLQQLLEPQPTWLELLGKELRDRLKQLSSPDPFAGGQNSIPTNSDSTTTYSVVVQFFEDFDFIEPVLRQLTWVDEIIINDGPFTFAVDLLTPVIGRDLETASERMQELCIRLSTELDVPIHYHYHCFDDEREKRIYGYRQALGEVVLSVDADEVLLIHPEQVFAFSQSSYRAASFNCFNYTFMNLLLVESASAPLASPKPFAFKRNLISAEEHINYLWLVGVDQQPPPGDHFLPDTLCDGVHLTTIRSAYGASIKFGFYNCLYFKRTGKALGGVYAEALNFFRGSDYPIDLRTEVLARAMPDSIGFPVNKVFRRPGSGDVPLAILEAEAKLSHTFNHTKVQPQIGGSLLPSIPTYLLCTPGDQLTVALSVAGNARLRVVPVQLEGEPFTLANAISEHTWIAEPLSCESLAIKAPKALQMENNPIAFLLELTLWIAPQDKERFSAASLAPTFNLAVR